MIYFAGITLLMFGDVLFRSDGTIFSKQGADLECEFVPWRKFGFDQMRAGHLPLWNPHNYSGTPFLGNFQSALLYPPNWLHLVLPLPVAINWGIALHVFLAGLFTAIWVRWRGASIVAALLAGTLFMFSGPYFAHLYPGHLPHLCTMPWAPLILLAIDRLRESASLGAVLLGAFAVAMQVLAGHPQYAYYTGIAAALYVIVSLRGSVSSRRLIIGFAAIYLAGIALSAVQLFPGMAAARESVRAAGTTYAFASSYSIPLKSLLTFLVPSLFGDPVHFPYFGPYLYWEMCAYGSSAALALAVYGAVVGGPNIRRAGLVMILLAILLALGAHTPLYRPLYLFLPGYSTFRAPAKFLFIGSLFLSLLAAAGYDRLRSADRFPGRFPLFTACAAGVFFAMAAALGVRQTPLPLWSQLLDSIAASGESFLGDPFYHRTADILATQLFAARQCVISGAILMLLTSVLLLARRHRYLTLLVALLCGVEIFAFARDSRATMQIRSMFPAEWEQIISRAGADDRFFFSAYADAGIAATRGLNDIWGYDPTVLGRYRQLMAFTQGEDPDDTTLFVNFHGISRVFEMLRCKAVFLDPPQAPVVLPNPLPRLLLLGDWRLVPHRVTLFKILASPLFDPRHTVLLETPPTVAATTLPVAGSAHVVRETSDLLEIVADVPAPCILLVTDSYSSGWRAKALPDSTQREYAILPANYVLRAVPLAAGHHHFVMQYAPPAFATGGGVSAIAWLGWLIALGITLRNSAPSTAAPITARPPAG